MNSRFYVVWNPAANAPRVRHDTYASAISEARRLAKANPTEEFIVLAAIASATVPDPVLITEYAGRITIPTSVDDYIPF